MPTLAELLELQNNPQAYVGYPQLQRQAARMRQAQAGREAENLPDPRTYGFLRGLLGANPDELGMSVLSPNTAKAKEAAYYGAQLSNLAQIAPAMMPATKAALRGAGGAINDAMVYGTGPLARITPQPLRIVEDTSYRGSHTAPGPDFGAQLHDLTGGGKMYPADIYSAKAVQYYGGGMPYDQKAMSIAQQYKDKPNAMVTIYRAVPKEKSNSEKIADIERNMAAYMRRKTLPQDAHTTNGSQWYEWAHGERERLRNLADEPAEVTSKINPGDWVTLTREYAKDHGESALKGKYKIISKKVKAKDIWTNADSIHEFGYHPE
jgi:hypothetical protein